MAAVVHPLQQPWIGIVILCNFQLDEHATAEEHGTTLDTLLS